MLSLHTFTDVIKTIFLQVYCVSNDQSVDFNSYNNHQFIIVLLEMLYLHCACKSPYGEAV